MQNTPDLNEGGVSLFCDFSRQFLEAFSRPVGTDPQNTCAPSTIRRRNLETHQSPVSLDLCLRKTRSSKSHDYRNVILFSKLFPSTRKRKAGVFEIPLV